MLEKYLELSQISQTIELENRQLRDALIKLDADCQILEETLKKKDLMIADLLIEKNRLRDMLTLSVVEVTEFKEGSKIPAENPSFLDRLFRGAQ